MSQASIEPSGAGPGSSFSLAVRNALAAIATAFAGASAPADSNQPYAFMRWIDTTLGYVKRRNAANTAWVTEGKVDGFLADGLCRALKLEVLNSDLTQVVISVGDITVEGTYLPPLANGTIDTNTTVGLIGALDTGAWAINTWYAVWAVCNADGTARGYIASLSSTSPTLPTGYTRKRRLGWIRTTGTATNLQKFRQLGNRALWHRDSNNTDQRVVDTNSAVGTLATTFATLTLTNAVPPTTVRAIAQGRLRTNGSNAAEVELIVQPTGAGLTPPAAIRTANVAPTASAVARQGFEIDLNSSRQFDWAVSSTTNVSDADIDILGWEDLVL